MSRRRSTALSVSQLEARLTPASVLTFTDVDGDRVTVTASVGNLSNRAIFADVGAGKQLRTLDLTGGGFQGANIAIVATPAAGGDGRVNVGFINATGSDLGTVSVDGDLGAIDAGDGVDTTSACKGLTVRSLGRLATATGAPDLESDFRGRLDRLTVGADVKDARVVVGPSASGTTDGRLGPVFIGGSLLGGPADNSGQLTATHGIGPVTIHGDILGGAGVTSGAIASTGDVAGVHVGGSVRGGSGASSGAVFSFLGAVGPVTVGGDVAGGDGNFSGRVFAETRLATVTVGGSLLGGRGADSGKVHGNGDLGPVTVGRDVRALDPQADRPGARSATITTAGKLGDVTVGGSLAGGGSQSGQIQSGGDLGAVRIAGRVNGGAIAAGANLTSLTVGGSVFGGVVSSDHDMGPVRIGHDLQGSILARGRLASLDVGGSIGNPFFTGAVQTGGDLGPVRVGGDMESGSLLAGRLTPGSRARLARVTIGGSLIASDFIAPVVESGLISSTGDMGPVSIGRDMVGSNNSAALRSTGSIVSRGTLAGVRIGGSLVRHEVGGAIQSAGDLGPVTVGGDVAGGSIRAGTVAAPGGTGVVARIAGVTVGGSLAGDLLTGGGTIQATGDIGPVRIGKDIFGGSDGEPTGVFAGDLGAASPVLSGIAGVTVGGSVVGLGTDSGQIFAAGRLGPVRIAGDVRGGLREQSGRIATGRGDLAGVTIGGSLVGNQRDGGQIHSAGNLGPVVIGGDVIGGNGALTDGSGLIRADGDLAAVTIGGSLIGGSGGVDVGAIFAHGNLGPVQIGGDVRGGKGIDSGFILANGNAAGVTIGGSLLGGTSNFSGAISVGGDLGPVAVGRDVRGSSIAGSDPGLDSTGSIRADGRIAGVTVGGSMVAGTDTSTAGSLTNNATIRAGADLGALTVRGSLIGNAAVPVIISARGQRNPTAATDLAIGKIAIGGRVERALILAGVNLQGNAVNADAQIGPVTVGGDWIASSLAAGASPGPNGFFGDGDDRRASGAGVTDDPGRSSRIASVTIGGQALGTSAAGDHFGIVAEAVGPVIIGGGPLRLSFGGHNDDQAIGVTGDFRVNELPEP